MMKVMIYLFLFSLSSMALEIDERLTFRLIKTSESRKTILMNRGTEDGLAEGDHAKFFISAGVVARGVCIKVSPSRSVWSIYRLVNADFLTSDSVMNLKITPPVKITQDESKMIVQEDTPSTVVTNDIDSLGIPLAEGAKDLTNLDDVTLQGMSQRENMMKLGLIEGNIRDRNDEVIAMLALANLGGKTNNGASGYTGSDGFFLLNLSWEHYLKNEQDWWGRFSPILFYQVLRQQTLAFQGSQQSSSINEFGGGLNWHPWRPPSQASEFIPYFNFSMSAGRSETNYEPGAENASLNSTNITGRTFAVSMGGGVKFYTMKGYGARMMIDYHSRNENFTDLSNVSSKRSFAGLRIFSGFSYRW
jgi:hypothetical protein